MRCDVAVALQALLLIVHGQRDVDGQAACARCRLAFCQLHRTSRAAESPGRAHCPSRLPFRLSRGCCAAWVTRYEVQADQSTLLLVKHDVLDPIPVAVWEDPCAHGSALEKRCEHDTQLALANTPLTRVFILF